MSRLQTRQTLLIKIKDLHDRQAWNEFVELYTPLIFGFLKNRGLVEDDALDVSQEVMRSIYRSIESFHYDPNRGTFRSWLFTVTRRRLMDFFQKQARRPKLRGGETAANLILEVPDAREERDWVVEYKQQMFQWAAKQVRDKFSENVWMAFWKTAIEEKDPSQVGGELGMTRGAVYAAKARVIGALRECVQQVTGEWDLT